MVTVKGVTARESSAPATTVTVADPSRAPAVAVTVCVPTRVGVYSPLEDTVPTPTRQVGTITRTWPGGWWRWGVTCCGWAAVIGGAAGETRGRSRPPAVT